MNLSEEMERLLQEKAQDWSPEDRAQAVALTADLGVLVGRQAAGEDVEQEIKIVRASLDNLGARAAVQGGKIASEVIARFVGYLTTLLVTV